MSNTLQRQTICVFLNSLNSSVEISCSCPRNVVDQVRHKIASVGYKTSDLTLKTLQSAPKNYCWFMKMEGAFAEHEWISSSADVIDAFESSGYVLKSSANTIHGYQGKVYPQITHYFGPRED